MSRLLLVLKIIILIINGNERVKSKVTYSYFRVARIVDNVDTLLITITLGGWVGGIGLLSTVVAAPVVIVIERVALFTRLFSITGKYSIKKSTSKAEKHENIKTIACTKLNTIASHIS